MSDLVPYETRSALPTSEHNPSELVEIANRASALAQQNAGMAMEYALAAKEQALIAGRALREAKGQVAHGEWLPFLDAHFDGSRRLAQFYMQIADPKNAKRVSLLPPEASLRQAIAAVSSSPTEETTRELTSQQREGAQLAGEYYLELQAEYDEWTAENHRLDMRMKLDELKQKRAARAIKGPTNNLRRDFAGLPLAPLFDHECLDCGFHWDVACPRCKRRRYHITDHGIQLRLDGMGDE